MVARTRRARVTGIGGIFFKAKNPKALLQWYRRHLGIAIEDSVALFTRRGGKDWETGTAYHGGGVIALHGAETQAFLRLLRWGGANGRVERIQAEVAGQTPHRAANRRHIGARGRAFLPFRSRRL